MSQPKCRECGAVIRWVYPRWRKGAMPLDLQEVTSTEETFRVYTAGGHFLRRAQDGAPLTGYPCHFDTCPARQKAKV